MEQKNVADQQSFSKYTFVKTEQNGFLLKFHAFSPIFLCEQQKERWKEANTYESSTDIGCGTLPTTVLKFIKTDNA